MPDQNEQNQQSEAQAVAAELTRQATAAAAAAAEKPPAETTEPRRRRAPPPIPDDAAAQIRAFVRDEVARLAWNITEPKPDDGAMLHEFKAKIRASLVEAGHLQQQESEASS